MVSKVRLVFLLLFGAMTVGAETMTVEQRRDREVLIDLHRGAWEFAPPNTMAAFRAALYWGGDVLEVDIRRTADGQLVCFHDEMVDGDLDGVGAVADLTYAELKAMPFSARYPEGWRGEPVPLFSEVLAFAREHGLLFHLDIKVEGIDGEVAAMLSAANYWQGVATVNDYNSEAIRGDPRYRPLPVKGGLLENHLDCEFDRVEELIEKEGRWLILDDPRLAAAWLGRLEGRYVLDSTFVSSSPLERLESAPADSIERWLAVVGSVDDGMAEEELPQRIAGRARAALELGRRSAGGARVLAALRGLLDRPARHPDYRFHGLDAAMAARALGRLRDEGSLEALRAGLRASPGEALTERLLEQGWKREFVWWLDYRIYRECIFALGQIGSPEAVATLEGIVAGEMEMRAEAAPELRHLAAEALARNGYPTQKVVAWLEHADVQVRRRAFLTILERPGVETTRALRQQIQLWIRTNGRDAIALAVSAAPFLCDSQCIPFAARSFSHPRIRAALDFAKGRGVKGMPGGE